MIKKFSLPLFIIVFPIFIFDFINFEKSLYVISFIYLFLLSIYLMYSNKNTTNFFSIGAQRNKNYKLLFSFLSLFIFILISQNYLLKYETVSWDVPSYLVSTYDVKQGNLPFTSQWESKGPLLAYVYNFLLILSNNSFVYFKIVNDLILYLISIIIFLIVYKKQKSILFGLLTSLFFSSLMSMRWYLVEYSELYCVLFLSISHYIYENKKIENVKSYFLIGIFISLSSLINQVTVLFLIPVLVLICYRKFNIRNFKALFLGSLLPQLLFFFLYLQAGLAKLYLANYISIPLGYSNDVSESNFYELRVYLREFFQYNEFLYLAMITTIFISIYKLVQNPNLNKNINFVNLNVIISLSIYFIGAHNYSNHLFYFLYFLVFLSLNSNYFSKHSFLFMLLIIFTVSSIFISTYSESFSNLKNVRNIEDDYPLYKLSRDIDSYFQEDYSIFALEYVLILHYLNLPNYSYIVHPTNHFENYITKPLINAGVILPDQVNILLNQEPDVIICNSIRIHKGKPLENKNFDCSLDYYEENYELLDTSMYRSDKFVEYYFDPYKEMNVFIKKDR